METFYSRNEQANPESGVSLKWAVLFLVFALCGGVFVSLRVKEKRMEKQEAVALGDIRLLEEEIQMLKARRNELIERGRIEKLLANQSSELRLLPNSQIDRMPREAHPAIEITEPRRLGGSLQSRE
ncbi:MAG: hypothetical protein AAF514_13500 [Verrucomicrobiota bacterium]